MERFCELVERAESQDRECFARDVVEMLGQLIAESHRIGSTERSDIVWPGGPSHEQWGHRRRAVQGTLDDWDTFQTVLSPLAETQEESALLLVSDQLADAWQCLRELLGMRDAGASLDDVLWEWRLGFNIDWGFHAVEALRALHARLAECSRSG